MHTFIMGLFMLIMGALKVGFIENVYSMSCMYGYIFISSIIIAL